MPNPVSDIDRNMVPRYLAATAGLGHALMYGPPGTGKTYIAMSVAPFGQKITEVTIRGNAGDYTLWGQDVPSNDENGNLKLEWRAGPACIAVQEGHILVVNEIDKMSQDLADRFHFLADHWSVAQDTLPDGTVIRIDPKFRIIGTTNAPPDSLSDPIRDRFAIKLFVAQPSEDMYQRLDPDVREVCREKYKPRVDSNGQPTNEAIYGPSITFRNCLNFCSIRLAVGDDVASQLVFDDRTQSIAFNEALAMARQKVRAAVR